MKIATRLSFISPYEPAACVRLLEMLVPSGPFFTPSGKGLAKGTSQIFLTHLKTSSGPEQVHFHLYANACDYSRRRSRLTPMMVTGCLDRLGTSTQVEMGVSLSRGARLIAALVPVALLAINFLPPLRPDLLLGTLVALLVLGLYGYLFYRPAYRTNSTQLALLVQAALTGSPEMPAGITLRPPVDTRPVRLRDKVAIVAGVGLLLGGSVGVAVFELYTVFQLTASTEGTVVDLWKGQRPSHGLYTYYVRYRYDTPLPGGAFTKVDKVTGSLFGRLRVASPVTVHYAPDKPALSRVERVNWAKLTSAVAFLAFGVLVYVMIEAMASVQGRRPVGTTSEVSNMWGSDFWTRELAFREDTFCGLYCGACDVFQANKRGTVEELAHACEMQPLQLVCHGCKTSTNSVYCVDCDIKACATAKDLEYCFQCADYPCARLVAFRNDDAPHHSAVLHNLDRMRAQGLARWLAEQRARWSCPHCGMEFTWYDRTCTACGAALYNCEAEERDLAGEDRL